MAAKFIILLAIVGATCALTASPKFRRDAQSSASSSSSASGGSSWSWSSNSSISIDQQVSVMLSGSDHTSILDLTGFGYLKEKLSHADFSNITSITIVPPLLNVDLLPFIPDMKESLEHARSRLAISLTGIINLQSAIQDAAVKAIHAPSPVPALANMCYVILNTYYSLAVNSPFYIGTTTILEEGMQVLTSTLQGVAKVVLEVDV